MRSYQTLSINKFFLLASYTEVLIQLNQKPSYILPERSNNRLCRFKMRLTICLFSRSLRQRLIYSAFGISRDGERVTLPNRSLEAGKVMLVGQDSCFVAPPSSRYWVFGEFKKKKKITHNVKKKKKKKKKTEY